MFMDVSRTKTNMKLQSAARQVFDSFLTYLAVISGVLVVFMMAGVSADVVLRKYFGMPIFWMVDITMYSLLYMAFLSGAWLLRQEGHVRMDLVVSRLSPGVQSALKTFTSLLGALTCLVLAWYSGRVVWEQHLIGYVTPTELRIPQIYIYGIVPVGSFLLFIQFLRIAYSSLRKRPPG